MDCNLFSLYVNLKGAKQVSSQLGVSEDDLKRFLPQVGFNNQDFFQKAVECVKDLKNSSDLKTTSQYFQIPEEMVRALTEEGFKAGFLITAKELISSKIDKKCSKSTQTSNDYLKANDSFLQSQNLSFQVPNNPYLYQYPGISTPKPSQPMQVLQANNLGQSIASPQSLPIPILTNGITSQSTPSKPPSQTSPTVLSHQVSSVSATPPKHNSKLSPSPTFSSTSSLSKSLPSSHLKKTINISLFKDHRPVQGNLINPDYSFHSTRQVS
jgi:hypothetical protein